MGNNSLDESTPGIGRDLLRQIANAKLVINLLLLTRARPSRKYSRRLDVWSVEETLEVTVSLPSEQRAQFRPQGISNRNDDGEGLACDSDQCGEEKGTKQRSPT